MKLEAINPKDPSCIVPASVTKVTEFLFFLLLKIIFGSAFVCGEKIEKISIDLKKRATSDNDFGLRRSPNLNIIYKPKTLWTLQTMRKCFASTRVPFEQSCILIFVPRFCRIV